MSSSGGFMDAASGGFCEAGWVAMNYTSLLGDQAVESDESDESDEEPVPKEQKAKEQAEEPEGEESSASFDTDVFTDGKDKGEEQKAEEQKTEEPNASFDITFSPMARTRASRRPMMRWSATASRMRSSSWPRLVALLRRSRFWMRCGRPIVGISSGARRSSVDRAS